jgi:LSD1 subclass zinc finger protein
MSVGIRCKGCKANLKFVPNATVVKCEYCNTEQPLPVLDSKKKIDLLNRANELRMNCEFDRAFGVYETIISEFQREAEAYWGLVLCKYGIEYVDDPLTHKKIPTCHRSSFDSVLDDPNYKKTLQYANPEAREAYIREANRFEVNRRGIIEVSSREEPYDVFICYKESDDENNRTLDSVLAQDIYDALVKEGYRVFFARITLKEHLGEAYEPYIFSALHSAKVMLAVGTKPEYYNAVWVKNEWSRYLALIAKGEKKKLFPCYNYKEMKIEDMPSEFRPLQSQDLSQIGAIQDLVRNIGKLIPKKNVNPNTVASVNTDDVNQAVKNAMEQYVGSDIKGLLERAYFFLEDRDFDEAMEYFNRVLDKSPRESQAYWGLLLVELECNSNRELQKMCVDLSEYDLYQKSIRFSNDSQRQTYETLNRNCLINLQKKKEAIRRKEERRKQYHNLFYNLKSKYTNQDDDVYNEFRQKVNEVDNIKKNISGMGGAKFSILRMMLYIFLLVLAILPVDMGEEVYNVVSGIAILVLAGFFIYCVGSAIGGCYGWIVSIIIGCILAALLNSWIILPLYNNVISQNRVVCIIAAVILIAIHLFNVSRGKEKSNKEAEHRAKVAVVNQLAEGIKQQAGMQLEYLNEDNAEFQNEWHTLDEIVREAWFTQECERLEKQLVVESSEDTQKDKSTAS